MASNGMLRRVALVRIDVSEEHSSSIIRVTRIGDLGTTLAKTSNRRTLRSNNKLSHLMDYLQGELMENSSLVTVIGGSRNSVLGISSQLAGNLRLRRRAKTEIEVQE
jgi:hypothetical protein